MFAHAVYTRDCLAMYIFRHLAETYILERSSPCMVPFTLINPLDERYLMANIHPLHHFADSVQSLGPLWAHSAFPFEDTNWCVG